MGVLSRLDANAAMAVLTAMITPAVLISACGLLILSTSTRLARVFDRVRALPARFDDLERRKAEVTFYEERRGLIFEQVGLLSRRGLLLQRSLTLYYLGVAMFVATSVAVGIVASGAGHPWIAVVMQLAGAVMLLAGSVMLILESRIALQMTNRELELIAKLGGRR
jgi:hypothetical protein